MTIEMATLENAAEILALQKLAYLSEARIYNDYAIPPLVQTLDELAEDMKRQTFLKAVEDGTIIGSVKGCLENKTCHVGRLIVHPSSQGNGVGTSLMDAIENAFQDAERFELFTGSLSVRNIALYQRLGYRVYKKEAVSQKLSLVFMEKVSG